MTVKDALSVMRDNAEIQLVWNNFLIPLDADNTLMVDAYGDYKVKEIRGGLNRNGEENCDSFEIYIAMQPIKEVRT